MATLAEEADGSKEQEIPKDSSVVSKKRSAAPITENGDRPQKKFYRQRGKSSKTIERACNFPTFIEIQLIHSFLSQIRQPTAILFRITTRLLILFGLIL
jgi:hypothetical protein